MVYGVLSFTSASGSQFGLFINDVLQESAILTASSDERSETHLTALSHLARVTTNTVSFRVANLHQAESAYLFPTLASGALLHK